MPEVPWLEQRHLVAGRAAQDAGWQYGSLAPTKEPEEPPAKLDADVAALLDEAEDIVNLAGIDILAEEDRKAKRKLFRKIPKKRKR